MIYHSTPSWGIESYKKGDTLHVWAMNGLNLRTKPNVKSATIAFLPFDEIVVVVDSALRNVPYSSIDAGPFKINGFWVKVISGTKIGYVFDGYLSKFKANKGYDEAYLKKVFGVNSSKMKTAVNWKFILEGKTCTVKTSSKPGPGLVIELPYMSFEEAYLLALNLIGFDQRPNEGRIEKRKACENFICIATEGHTDSPFAAFAIEKRSNMVLIFLFFNC